MRFYISHDPLHCMLLQVDGGQVKQPGNLVTKVISQLATPLLLAKLGVKETKQQQKEQHSR